MIRDLKLKREKLFIPISLSMLLSFSVINYDFARGVDGKYFVSNKERGSFFQAVEFCSQRGLELALPQSDKENSLLTEVFENKGNFGADMKNRPLTFTSWAEGQPDKSIQDPGCTTLSEDCVWRVTSECSMNAYIVCHITLWIL
uniref:C-type lectin domain-containing protein n=1 Tax=Haplochromis burtoni TaxID=8153 RepID=A0A3Q2VS79_HAPBU